MTSRRLPDDPAYWENLAQHIEQAVWNRRERQSLEVLEWLAARIPLMAGAALAAAAVLMLVVGEFAAPRGVRDGGSGDWTSVFAPRDTIGRQLSAARPPALGGLIAGAGLRGREARNEP